ncbi:MAG: hypothetical protein B6D59_05145 [Campylobacteraceae bacterium 4484_4]|nr:MAG: hypothetical protein B6D59_05145 [Campylobacteraceae bacterium 4484_4]
MKKTFFLMLCVSGLFATLPTQTIEEKIRAQNVEVLKMAVSSIRPQLPQRVDDYTQIVGIEAEGEHLIYTFEVDTDKSGKAVTEESKRRMQKRIREGICHSSKRFLQSGITISYLYQNAATHQEFFKVTVAKKDCALDFQKVF